MDGEVRSRKNRSMVWNYMQRVNNKLALCMFCSHRFNCSPGAGTSNMFRHLAEKHSVEELQQRSLLTDQDKRRLSTADIPVPVPVPQPTRTKKRKAESVPKVCETPMVLVHGINRKQSLDKLLLSMIVEDLQPFTIVEHTGFIRLVKGLDPTYTLPNKKDLEDMLLPKVYEEVKTIICSELQATSSVSVSLELWTHLEVQTYMSISCHFISSKWDFCSVLLESIILEENYNSESIATELYRVFESWNISTKVFSITTDGCAEMAAAVAQLNINHQVCYAHTLNDVVHQAIKNVGRLDIVREKVSAVLMFFKTDNHAMDTLTALQKVKGMNDTPKLKTNLDSRWTSLFRVFQRYVDLHKYVTQALKSLCKQDLIISEEDFHCIRECVKALEPFDAVTKELTDSGFTSLSKVLPTTKSLMRFISNYPQSSDLSVELKSQLDLHFSKLESNMFNASATYLDPRFRELMFEDIDTCTNVQEELKSMMDLGTDQSATVTSKQSTKKSTSTVSLWSAFDERVQSTRTPHLVTSQLVSDSNVQFCKYETEPLILRHDNPLEWWQVKKELYPNLCKLSKQFMGVPATCVPPHRFFNKVGQNWVERRANLQVEDSMINIVLFLNQNCKGMFK